MKKTILLLILVSFVIGSLIALFLTLLQAAIDFRFEQPWLLYLLPVAGVFIHFIYQRAGSSSEKGNNLILEEIHQPAAGVPGRMGPVILLTTLITHLFGGSAGREGTAVQIGGSTAAMFAKWFKINPEHHSLLLTCGIAAGFGAVFGTPFTGAIFALEVLTLGKMKYKTLLPALLAGLLADFTVKTWGVHHHVYAIDDHIKQNLGLIFKIILASVAFGLASLLFSKLTHSLQRLFNRWIKIKWLIPVIGGLLLIGLTLLNGKPDYLSLGVDAEYAAAVTIPSAFNEAGAEADSWIWKTVYTAVTLSTGYKGGEVTPLFYIGATLGNALSVLLDAPASLFAALGFIAVFAGATNTPLACTVMGMELFDPAYALLFAIACFTAYLCSGHSGIYPAQRRLSHGLLATNEKASQGHWHYLHIKVDKYRLKFSRKKKSE